MSLSSWWDTVTPASAGDPPALAGRSGSVTYGVTAPSPGSQCTYYFVCALPDWSLFPPVLSRSCNQIPLTFIVWFSRNSSSRCWTSRLGSLTWGSEPSLQCVDFCGISVVQFVSHPPSSYGICLYCDCAPPTVSLWLLCLWKLDIFFCEFQCFPVNDFSAVSCDSGALARGSESTFFYSAIFNTDLFLVSYPAVLCVCVCVCVCVWSNVFWYQYAMTSLSSSSV